MAEISWECDGHCVPMKQGAAYVSGRTMKWMKRLFQLRGAVHEVLLRRCLALEFVTQEPTHMRLGAFCMPPNSNQLSGNRDGDFLWRYGSNVQAYRGVNSLEQFRGNTFLYKFFVDGNGLTL